MPTRTRSFAAIASDSGGRSHHFIWLKLLGDNRKRWTNGSQVSSGFLDKILKEFLQIFLQFSDEVYFKISRELNIDNESTEVCESFENSPYFGRNSPKIFKEKIAHLQRNYENLPIFVRFSWTFIEKINKNCRKQMRAFVISPVIPNVGQNLDTIFPNLTLRFDFLLSNLHTFSDVGYWERRFCPNDMTFDFIRQQCKTSVLPKDVVGSGTVGAAGGNGNELLNIGKSWWNH